MTHWKLLSKKYGNFILFSSKYSDFEPFFSTKKKPICRIQIAFYFLGHQLTKIHTPKKTHTHTHTHTTYNMCSKLSLNQTNLIDLVAYETTQCKKVCTNLLPLHEFVTLSNYYSFDTLATLICMLCLLETTHFAYSWGHTFALSFF